MNNKAMRLFTALRFNEKTISEIAEIQKQLIELDPKAKFVKPVSNFHLTLYFIGMTEKVDIVKDSFLSACEKYRDQINEPIAINFTKLGKFKKRKGNVIWLGAKENKDMMTLAELIPDELEKNGIPVNRQNFKAHITLARDFRDRLTEQINLPENVKIDQAALVWSHRDSTNTLVYDNILKSALLK